MDNRTIEEVRNNEDRLIDNIEKLEQQLKKKDEVIEKIKSNIKNDMDGFGTINEHGESNHILELLEIYLQILEDKEVG